MKILVNISGASGVEMGFYLLKSLEDYANLDDELFAVCSKGAKICFCAENDNFQNANPLTNDEFISFCKEKFALKKTHFFDDENLASAVSSGSFGIDKTIIAPCSLNTLAQIKQGISDTLITRSAAVALKEKKTLILAVREMPFSTLVLKQMFKLSKMGVIIAPPVFASYAGKANLEDFKAFIIGKWLDLLEVKHDLYKKWQKM